MGLFYAYANTYDDDFGKRFVIIFPSRNVADEWYRTLQDRVAAGKLKFASVKRVTPQFYLYDSTISSRKITLTVKDSEGTPEFLGKVIFSPQWGRTNNGRMDIIPVQKIVDHISGNLFFIRSRFDPTLFWYHSVDDGGFIKASRTERTRFRVSIRPRGSGSAKDHQSDTENYDGKIMIGSDNVQISLASDDNRFVCAMGPDDDEVSKATSAFDVAKRMLVQGETMSVVVRESFSASAAPNPSDPVDSEGKPDTVGDVESKQGILKVGKTPENFRFREILDGLFDEWELA